MSESGGQSRLGARSQRLRFGALSLTILLASTVAFVSLDRIGRATGRRFDATATGEHRLAPRTRRVLEALPEGCRVVLAVDRRTLEPGAVAMLRDALDTLDRGSDRLETDWIDTGSESGRAALDRSLRGLAASQAPAIESYRGALAAAAESLGATGATLEASVAPALDQIGAGLPEGSVGRTAFQERAALLRVLARDGGAAATTLAGATAPPGPESPTVPAYDGAWRGAEPVAQNLDAQLDALSRELGEYARSSDGTPASRDAARGLANSAAEARAPLARAIETVRTTGVPAVIRVARAIEADRAALAVGPGASGLVAIDLDALVAAAGAPAAEARGRVESLLGTALGTLLNPDPPIVVLVHAENPALLARAGLYEKLSRHLSARAIDLVMWPIAVSESEPPLRDLDPSGRRPVVYVVLSTDSAAQGRGSGVLPGIERAQRLGRVCKGLLDRGESLLLSVSPSVIPTTGSPDPMVGMLEEMGVRCDTSRPLVHERLTPAGRSVTTPIAVSADAGVAKGHALAGAIRGLPLFMAWPIRLWAEEVPPGVEVSPLVTHRSASWWGESQWLGLWQVAIENQATLPSAPSRDARDFSPEEGSSMVLAYAIERAAPAGDGSQRLVVVGTHSYGQYGWLADPITHDQSVVDGRTTRSHPGNLELFDASIAFLAGLDTLIAQSPEAGDSPTIRALDEGTLRMIRLWLALGLPAGVLVVGAAVSVVRRR
jgi:hypothetical protein